MNSKNKSRNSYYLGIDFWQTQPIYNRLRADRELFPDNCCCMNINNKIFIYSKSIKILFTNDFIAKNRKTQIDEQINGLIFYKEFEKGFNDGIIKFDEDYKVTPEILFGTGGKVFERNLHHLYFHSKVNNSEGGWKKYLDYFPLTLQNKDFYFYGFYNAMIHKLEELKIKYPALFINFNKHNEIEVEADNTKLNLQQNEKILPPPKSFNDGGELIDQINNSNKNIISEQNINNTNQIITDEFKILNNSKGWDYAFFNENDFISFKAILINFFEFKPYQLTEVKIKLKRNCKTKLAKTFNNIHKNLSENSLRSDVKFFQTIRVLSHFEKMSDSEIYHAITR